MGFRKYCVSFSGPDPISRTLQNIASDLQLKCSTVWIVNQCQLKETHYLLLASVKNSKCMKYCEIFVILSNAGVSDSGNWLIKAKGGCSA